MRTWLTICVLMVLSFSIQAELYKWVNKDGETVYSDTPPNDTTEPIKLPEISVTPAVKYKPRQKPEQTSEKDTKAINYTDFKIQRPVNNAIIRDNPGNLSVSLSLQPDLAADHSINVLLDGQVLIQNHKRLSAQLNNIDRGSHSLSAQVVDKNGKVIISSNSVSFTLLRYSKLHNKPPPPPPAPKN